MNLQRIQFAFLFAMTFLASCTSFQLKLVCQDSQSKPIRLFLLSGQSNMKRLDHERTFLPMLKQAYPNEDVVVVKVAEGGQLIRRWDVAWQPPSGVRFQAKPGEQQGDLYRDLISQAKSAAQGRKVTSVCFFWMQGESDAQRGLAGSYEASLRRLLASIRTDLRRPEMGIVIGRISDCHNGQAGWNAVRIIQERVTKSTARTSIIDTDDLNGPSNDLHLTDQGYDEFGKRLAKEAIRLCGNVTQDQQKSGLGNARKRSTDLFQPGTTFIGSRTLQDPEGKGKKVEYKLVITERQDDRFSGDFYLSGNHKSHWVVQGTIDDDRINYEEQGDAQYQIKVTGKITNNTVLFEFRGTRADGGQRFGTGTFSKQ